MRIRRWLAACAAAAVVAAMPGATASGATGGTRDEPYRPQIHFSPERNWMNDPNGLVWYQGEWHLFYQHNPEGAQWGNMSWGHAVSRDLFHWEELPVALPYSADEHIFSGSIVVDERNTSGFGRPGVPAMVAVYTSAYPATGIQAQSLAYSTDRGRTWTKYAGNPVLDLGSREFRDPKVFWDAEADYWVMAIVLATEHKVRFYRSADLKAWTYLSDFGPANATGGVWEVPDLFEVPVDGDPQSTKWVLVVNLNPGSVAGGSGAQYFVGDWDGTTFTADNMVTGEPEPPAGTLFADFDGDYAGWTIENDPTLAPGPFGTAPYPGTVPGQQLVSGFRGRSLVNSFLGFDTPKGRMVSPEFTLDQDFLNLLVGGGAHPHLPGTTTEFVPEGAETVLDFELPDGQTYEQAGWTATGGLRGRTPVVGPARSERGHVGDKLLTTFYEADTTTGTLTSPAFPIDRNHLSVLVGAGGHVDANARTVVELLIDGEVVRTGTGNFSGFVNWRSWDVAEYRGRSAQLRIVDENTGGWGHLLVDHLIATDEPVLPRSVETAVNLVVEDEVVRTATGKDSERLDWVAWDVRDLAGRRAHLEINDFNSGGWGHILVDHVMFADRPARSELERYDWVDYGKDYYAAISYNGVPGGERVLVGWMNNWQYAGGIPTSPWRGAMALPREFGLATIDGEVRLVQRPVSQIRRLRGAGGAYALRDAVVGPGVRDLPAAADGTVLEIEAEFELRDADRFGLHVRGGGGERTVIGYDAAARRLYVDRTRSGDVGFSALFPGVHSGPLSVDGDRVRMTIYVDRSSVEVFGGAGQTTITDQIFPAPGSDQTRLFAEGGEVLVRSLTVRPLRSVWR
ncbi:sucrose-6-phosphate hydrolase SacC (GH32 family) [Micromonospora sp. A200]|uniref:glycoside hydrolase family 32 protein n=1 Tax=Micromonospora sp. A200 TaxID=2940568 RepID=UPI0024766AAA|nr:glycoside hydrolase family 32 protein [Micromonospora sp. A200]MDH6466289.1 sucrose-6-phosphate hydrolase SacC (GH32 family) [Micromonospora sp. A200]